MVKLLDGDIKTREVLQWKGVHLIHFINSSCSQKTRIFLNLKAIQWQSHHLNLAAQANYEPWFLGINPRGLVPVLVHDGQVHIESNDILAYLEETFPQPPLMPAALRQDIQDGLREEDDLHLDIRALTMRFLAPKRMVSKKPRLLEQYRNDQGTISGAADPHKAVEIEFWRNFADHGITDQQVRHAARRFHEVYQRWEERLAQSAFLCGETITLLDIAWFIYTHRLAATGYPFSRLHSRVHSWYRGLLARDEFQREVKMPGPMRVAVAGARLGKRVSGRSLSALAGF